MKLLVSAWAGMGNVGDDWLAATIVDALPSCDVALLLEPGARAERLPPDCDILHWPVLSRHASARDIARFRRSMRTFDAVMLAGGGWFAGDQGPYSLARWAGRLRLVRRPVIALGLGVGPFPGVLTRITAKFGLRRIASPLLVRTEIDRREASALGRRDADSLGDPTFAASIGLGDVPRHGVVVAVARPASHWASNEGEVKYLARVAALARRCASGERVTFLSFQTSPATARDEDPWYGIADEVVVPGSVAQALQVMNGARAAVTGRYHASVMAARLSVPQIAIAYHHKFDDLRQLGVPVVPLLADLSRTEPMPPDIEQVTARGDRVSRALEMVLERYGS